MKTLILTAIGYTECAGRSDPKIKIKQHGYK